MDRLVSSIDGGGTKTSGLMATPSGDVFALTPSKGSNPQDGTDWRAELGAVLDQVRTVDFAVVGVPGYSEIPSYDRKVADYVNSKLSAPHSLINDVELAYVGAFPSGDGVLLLAGTGSMAVSGQGTNILRAGGWGGLIGDEGSAHWIGHQALLRAAAEIDGTAPTTGFASRLGKAIEAPVHKFGILEWAVAEKESRARIASLAQVIDVMVSAGDSVAGDILDEAAEKLVALARAVSMQPMRWAPSGSVFKSERITQSVTRKLGPATPPAATARVGGLFLAAKSAGWTVSGDWQRTVSSNAQNIFS